MKRILTVLGFAILTASWLSAGELSKEDRQRAIDHLKKTRDAFLASTAGLSEAQWNFKPTPERWSVGEVSEHLVAAEEFLMSTVQDVMKAPPRSEPADLNQIDDFVLNAIADRTNKVKAPEPLIPTRRFGGMKPTLQHFKDSRAKTLAFLAETKDLRDHATESPLGKTLDAYQWLLFISAHCERHTKQINEVKADPNFPKA